MLIADPDIEARASIARVLEADGYEVLEVDDGVQAVAMARDCWPAAAILEIPLGTISGYEVCRTLKADQGNDIAVIFLSGARTEPYDCVAGLLIGADDYITKPSAPDEVLARVRTATQRIRPAAGLAPNGHLTPREHEVLALLSEGLRWGEIADRLVISPKTVATHAENIRRKLGVSTRAEAIAVAYRQQLLAPPAAPPPIPPVAPDRDSEPG